MRHRPIDYRMSLVLFNAGIGCSVILLLVGGFIQMSHPLPGNTICIIGFLPMIIGMIQALLFYKCPHCGQRFNLRGKLPAYCPHCGAKLERWDSF